MTEVYTQRDKLRVIFAECGLTVKEVAEAMNMGWSTLRNKLNGYRPWYIDEVVVMANAINRETNRIDNGVPKYVVLAEIEDAIGADRIILRGTLAESRSRT